MFVTPKLTEFCKEYNFIFRKRTTYFNFKQDMFHE